LATPYYFDSLIKTANDRKTYHNYWLFFAFSEKTLTPSCAATLLHGSLARLRQRVVMKPCPQAHKLSTALIDMMDHKECFIVSHANKSIVQNGVEATLGQPMTTSPWIYAELAASGMLCRQPTARDKLLKKAVEAYAEVSMTIEFQLISRIPSP
jgi:hypothetical protein